LSKFSILLFKNLRFRLGPQPLHFGKIHVIYISDNYDELELEEVFLKQFSEH